MLHLPVSADQRASYRYLLRWIVVAAVAGLVGAAAVALFVAVVTQGQELLAGLGPGVSQTAALGQGPSAGGALGPGVSPADTPGLLPPLYAAAAALLVGGLIYRLSPNTAGEGIPSYLYALNSAYARFPLRVTLLKLPAAALTLIGFGSGGVIGPVGRTVSGLMSLLGAGRTSPASREQRALRVEQARTAAICGMAATVAAVSHAPIGGGIFAVEIIQRANMRYRELFPAVLAGCVSVWFARIMGWEPLLQVRADTTPIELATMPWILLFAVVIAFLSKLFVRGYALTVRPFRRDQGNVLLKVLVGTAAGALLVWMVNPSFLGLAREPVERLVHLDYTLLYGLFDPAAPLLLVALTMLLLRMLAAYLTVGSGMSAGLTAPAVQIGLLAAVAALQLLAPVTAITASHALFAVGFGGMLAGAMNVPIAAAVMSIEVFGADVAVAAAFASIVAFQVNRHRTIYDYAIAGSGTLSEER